MRKFFHFRRMVYYSAILFVLITITWSCEKQANQAVVVTADVTNLSMLKCSIGGEVTEDGGAVIQDRGIMWGPYHSIVVGITHNGTGAGSFSTDITGLKPGNKYFAFAYASNSMGISYGDSVVFTTPDGAYDADGNEYNGVVIGTQTWLKQNLRTTKYYNGTDIPYGGEMTTPCYSWYNNDPANKDLYGAYYNWYAVNTGKLCPVGWHVPTESDWNTLTAFAGTSTKLQTTSGWGNYNGTDDFGFSAVPAGIIFDTNSYDLGIDAFWWTTASTISRLIFPSFLGPSVSVCGVENEAKLSVRCVKN